MGGGWRTWQGDEGELPPVLQNVDVREALLKNIQRRMTPQPLKIRADIELTCFHYDGVLHIKQAMREGQKGSVEECPVKASSRALARSPRRVHHCLVCTGTLGAAQVQGSCTSTRGLVKPREGADRASWSKLTIGSDSARL